MGERGGDFKIFINVLDMFLWWLSSIISGGACVSDPRGAGTKP